MLDELKAFVLFAETGSVQAVTRRLPLTQPAVTRQLQRLELALRAPLLDRRVKPPKLTAAGVETLQRARAILASIDELKAAVATNGEPQGRLRIGVAHALADAVLASSLDAVGRRFDRLSLQLVSGWTPELTAMVERGELDAAIVMSAGDERSRKPIQGRVIGQDLITIIASSQLRLAKQPLLQHLDRFGWVLTPDEACGTRAALRHVIEQRGGQFCVAAEVHDIELQAALVEKGLGIGLMPKRKFEQLRRRGLQALTVEGLHFEMRISIARSPILGRLTPAVDMLEDSLSTHFRSTRHFSRHIPRPSSKNARPAKVH